MATPPNTGRTEPRIAVAPPEEPLADRASDEGWDSSPARTRRRSPILALVLLLLLVAGAVFFYLWKSKSAHEPVVTAPPQTPPPVAAEATPAIRHPIEEAGGAQPPTAEDKPLPALMVSDVTMQNTLADLFGASSLGRVFYEDAIIHRFVSTVDNLPRKTLPARNLPVKPITGPLVTSSSRDGMAISADNAARYAAYVQVVQGIDAKKLVAAYVHFYPLIQQDYRDLGYPKGYFNDRLIEAIDDLLAAPESSDALALAQPKILYQYADPDLEARSAGEKIMMRIGSENATKVKVKLREIRSELTAARASATPAPK